MECQTIGILKERQPLDVSRLPFLRHAMLVKQVMNVAVAVRFRLYLEPLVRRLHRNARTIVQQRRNTLTLLNNCYLVLIHTKIIVFLQQGYRFRVGIAGRHNAERKLDSISKLFLNSKNVLNVKFQIACLGCHFCGQANLREKGSEENPRTTRIVAIICTSLIDRKGSPTLMSL